MFSKKSKSNSNELIVYSPVDGKAKDITKVLDEVFSKKMLGDGMVVEPVNGQFNSPIDGGSVKVAFETGHAYGIGSKLGPEILVHIGIDTVNLKGEGFSSKVKVGEKVNLKKQIAEVDIEKVGKLAPSLDTIIIVTQESIGEFKIEKVAKGEVKKGDVLFKLVK